MAKRVTEKQKLVLRFIADFIEENGYSPAIRDVSRFFKSSVKGAYDHVVALEKKALITRTRNRSRSILLTDRGKQVLGIEDQRRIPLLGRIAAGPLSHAEQYVEEFISIPMEALADDSAQHFALKIKGDS
ncbi:hypothetical protein IIA79_08355, partial [bacterium]|nr:hypothetical protein [bacterium]